MRHKLHQAKKCERLAPSSTGNRSHCQSHVIIKTHGCISHLTSHRVHSISFTLAFLPQRANRRCEKKTFSIENNQIHKKIKNKKCYSGIHVRKYPRSLYKKVSDSRRARGQINTNSLVRRINSKKQRLT